MPLVAEAAEVVLVCVWAVMEMVIESSNTVRSVFIFFCFD
jgi:hypothetical protein